MTPAPQTPKARCTPLSPRLQKSEIEQNQPAKYRLCCHSQLLPVLILAMCICTAVAEGAESAAFPRPLADYPPAAGTPLFKVLAERVRLEPFNLVATIIFFVAIVHTFLAPKFM